MKRNRYILLLSALLLTAGNVLADENKAEEKSPWKSSVELGFIRTTGNTETQTLTAKADAVYEVEKWRHTGHAEGYGSQAKNQSTGVDETQAERYELSGKTDYKFSELDYAYGIVKLKKDLFSGFEYEHVLSAGYGRKLVKQDDMELDVEIGPGERFFKVDGGQAQEESLLRLSAKYWWQITATSKFTQSLSSEIGEEITSNESITGVQASISESLALKFTYTLRNKSKVPPGNKHTDTEVAMTLVYNF